MIIDYMQRRCRWPESVRQLSGVSEDWLGECVAALDRVCWPEEVKDQLARIDHKLQRLRWTIADAVEYCCASGGVATLASGMWELIAPGVVSYARQTQRLGRLGLEQLRELSDVLAGVGGSV